MSTYIHTCIVASRLLLSPDSSHSADIVRFPGIVKECLRIPQGYLGSDEHSQADPTHPPGMPQGSTSVPKWMPRDQPMAALGSPVVPLGSSGVPGGQAQIPA